jgi:hypothetical protein
VLTETPRTMRHDKIIFIRGLGTGASGSGRGSKEKTHSEENKAVVGGTIPEWSPNMRASGLHQVRNCIQQLCATP